MLHIHLAVLALAVSAVAASGCGGSSKTTSASLGPGATQAAKTLTRTELIAKADAICAGVNARRAASPIRSPQDYTRLLPRLAAYQQTAAAELGKLVPPASMASDWKQIVTGTHIVASDIAKLGESTSTNFESGRARRLAVAGQATLQKMAAVAKHDGFKDCAKVS